MQVLDAKGMKIKTGDIVRYKNYLLCISGFRKIESTTLVEFDSINDLAEPQFVRLVRSNEIILQKPYD